MDINTNPDQTETDSLADTGALEASSTKKKQTKYYKTAKTPNGKAPTNVPRNIDVSTISKYL